MSIRILDENQVLVEMKHIPREMTPNNYSRFERCDMCHYDAFFQYYYNGEILYRCQAHKIKDITKLKHKWGY